MDERAISKLIVGARVEVLQKYPFFGRLLLRLQYGLASCGTAFTDMRRIVFDPEFAVRLSPQERQYVLIHEVLHCALKHCTRGGGKHKFLYNVACDIVVNSIILEMYHQENLLVDGAEMMHLAPNGKEGRNYTAEQVYAMLMDTTPQKFARMYCGVDPDVVHNWENQDVTLEEVWSRYREAMVETGGCGIMDNHDEWGDLEGTTLEDLWESHIRDASASCGMGNGIPAFMMRYLKEVEHTPRTNWRQVLHDFIQFDRSDYTFARPDPRYSGDFFLPSFCEDTDEGKVEKLWFLVDTSGSVSNKAVAVACDEIKQSIEQVGNVSGWLSYFNSDVTEPMPFDSLEELLEIKPTGCGGTSFYAIFRKLQEFALKEDLPKAVVILTDGYAHFPEEQAALGVPVIWIIVDSNVVPPWGVYAFIST